jgi:putative peptidoglycan lipid II flippase
VSGSVKKSPSLARSAGLVSGLTLLSRLLGLVREQVFAALLGAGLYADAFVIGFRIPNLLRDLFAEGALSAAFVPTYAAVLEQEGRKAAHRMACRLLTVLIAVMGALVLAGVLGAGPLVRALAPGFELVSGKVEAATLLTRVMFPFLALISVSVVAKGMLNAQERFGAPAFAPAVFNLATTACGLLLWVAGFDGLAVAIGWALGTLIGGAAQVAVQLPSLWREGFRFRPEWAPGDPRVRQVGALMAPATFGLAAVQINIFVNSIYASQDPGAVAWINYAFRILFLPIGVFGVALGTIAGAGLARRAAVADQAGMAEMLRQSLRMLVFLTIPASVGLMVLRLPVVRLIYEHGEFGPSDTLGTADALFFYAIGLVAYNGVKVLAPAFYALGSPRAPVLGSALAVAVNLLAILVLHPRMGFTAVALATTLGAIGNMLLLLFLCEARLGGLFRRDLAVAVLRMLVAAGAMGLAVSWAAATLEARLGIASLPAQLAVGLVPVLLGVALYALVAGLLGVEEVRELLAFAAGRARRRS